VLDLLLAIGIGLAGFVLGAFVFARVGHWLVGIHAVLKRSGVAEDAALLSALFVASGPWVLVAVGFFAIQVRAQPWANWLFGGIALAIAFFGALSFHLARKQTTRKQ